MSTSPLHRSRNRDGTIRVAPEAGDIVVLSFEGEFDRWNALNVGEHLDQALETGKDLVLDLSEITFLDSSVINELFRAAQAARGSGQVAVLELGAAPFVERILEFVRIESVLPRANNREEAIRLIELGAGGCAEPEGITG